MIGCLLERLLISHNVGGAFDVENVGLVVCWKGYSFVTMLEQLLMWRMLDWLFVEKIAHLSQCWRSF